MSDLPITGEVSNSKLVAVFDDAVTARTAASAIQSGIPLEASQVQVVLPGEAELERKLEPENRGIWRTIGLAHLKLGVLGGVVGALAFALMYSLGIQFIVQSPWAASLIFMSYGTIAGLFLGGLVVLRPDHDRYIQAARDAASVGRASVIVHAFSRDQAATAGDLLRKRGGEVTSTF